MVKQLQRLSDKQILFLYFTAVILLGSLFLYALPTWQGAGTLSYIDALFTSTSAVCVTGLITVDTAQYTRLGQSIIVLLIQCGGLGMLTFSTLFILLNRSKISMTSRTIIQSYYTDDVDYNPLSITKKIILTTLIIEAGGTLILFTQFHSLDNGLFISLFHAVSAFCNAGFSTFSDSLMSWNTNGVVLSAIMVMIILGGLSFVVINEGVNRMAGRTRRLRLHSKIVLFTTGILIAAGMGAFYFAEKTGALAELTLPYQILNALFHSVTPRTAGFNTLDMAQLSLPVRSLTTLFMFIGGAPGSIAGGVKVTTFFLIFMIVLKGVDEKGEIRFFKRKIPAKILSNANMFILKALFLLLFGVAALTFIEYPQIRDGIFTIEEVIFESVSAFGTVGLSLGITGKLSTWGKVIIIGIMFAGRVGLVSMATESRGKHADRLIDYPHGEVMIG